MKRTCEAEIAKGKRYVKCTQRATHRNEWGYLMCMDHATHKCRKLEKAEVENKQLELDLGQGWRVPAELEDRWKALVKAAVVKRGKGSDVG